MGKLPRAREERMRHGRFPGRERQSARRRTRRLLRSDRSHGATEGTRLIIDTSGAALQEALNEGVYLIKPNKREFEALIGESFADEQAMIRAARRLIDNDRIEIAAISLGHEGGLIVTRDSVWRAQAVPVQARSAVGAGDSFVGALAWSLANGDPLIESFRYAVAAGAAALLSPGTELCSAHDVLRLKSEVRIDPR